jgi:hypothetical protein
MTGLDREANFLAYTSGSQVLTPFFLRMLQLDQRVKRLEELLDESRRLQVGEAAVKYEQR